MNKNKIQKKPLEKPKDMKTLVVDEPLPPSNPASKKTAKLMQSPKIQTSAVEKVVKTKVTKRRIMDLPEEHDRYFVYLKNPMEYRRQLLESSRRILFCLKSNQKIILIRQRKLDEMKVLKASIKELIFLNKKFNDMLPKYHTGFLEGVHTEDKNRPVIPKSAPVRKSDPIRQERERTEMEKLEESLANIEKKLKSLQ